jgi:hypothetical protein
MSAYLAPGRSDDPIKVARQDGAATKPVDRMAGDQSLVPGVIGEDS